MSSSCERTVRSDKDNSSRTIGKESPFFELMSITHRIWSVRNWLWCWKTCFQARTGRTSLIRSLGYLLGKGELVSVSRCGVARTSPPLFDLQESALQVCLYIIRHALVIIHPGRLLFISNKWYSFNCYFHIFLTLLPLWLFKFSFFLNWCKKKSL